MVDYELVVDIGMHLGEDTGFYLHKGYRVVGVDADVRRLAAARRTHAAAIQKGRLALVHCAVAAQDGPVQFHLSRKSQWSSLKRSIADREQLHLAAVKVPARRPESLFAQYGVPFYCKIDVEGMDADCLNSLAGATALPRYLSVETECLGEGERITEKGALETLECLKRLGYRHFKLVDQETLAVASTLAEFSWDTPSLPKRALRRIGFWRHPNLCRLDAVHQYRFPPGSSGPFGADLDGSWLNESSAALTLIGLRRNFFEQPHVPAFGFWFDWHAML